LSSTAGAFSFLAALGAGFSPLGGASAFGSWLSSFLGFGADSSTSDTASGMVYFQRHWDSPLILQLLIRCIWQREYLLSPLVGTGSVFSNAGSLLFFNGAVSNPGASIWLAGSAIAQVNFCLHLSADHFVSSGAAATAFWQLSLSVLGLTCSISESASLTTGNSWDDADLSPFEWCICPF